MSDMTRPGAICADEESESSRLCAVVPAVGAPTLKRLVPIRRSGQNRIDSAVRAPCESDGIPPAGPRGERRMSKIKGDKEACVVYVREGVRREANEVFERSPQWGGTGDGH